MWKLKNKKSLLRCGRDFLLLRWVFGNFAMSKDLVERTGKADGLEWSVLDYGNHSKGLVQKWEVNINLLKDICCFSQN
jgi:hypothetical protein